MDVLSKMLPEMLPDMLPEASSGRGGGAERSTRDGEVAGWTLSNMLLEGSLPLTMTIYFCSFAA